MKKIVSLVGAGALLLATAGPAFAWGNWNIAIVGNSARAYSNTGGNSQSNVADVAYGGGVNVWGASGSRSMTTGHASSYAGALTVANTHVCDGGNSNVDGALIDNHAVTDANSGVNMQDDYAMVRHGGGVTVGSGAGNRSMTTGGTNSTSHAWTIVNTHFFGF